MQEEQKMLKKMVNKLFNLNQIPLILIIFLSISSSTAQKNMEYLRTPEYRFNDLSGYNYSPRYVFVDDYEGGTLRMHYIDEGPEDAPAVIMIHGNPTWIYQFRNVIPLLNDAGYRTIAIDLIGMGRSDKPVHTDDYTYDRHVGWTEQMFTYIDSALSFEEAVIFGHDYGTPIGIRLMNEYYPERFDGFIVANASLPDGSYISPVHLNWRQFVRDNPDVPVGHVISSQVDPPLSPQEIYAYYAPFPDCTYKEAVRTFPEMVPESPEDPEAIANINAWEYLETFSKPFMSIFGPADSDTFSARRKYIDSVPGAYGQPHPQLNVTHYAPEDEPEQVANQTIQFLDDLYHPDSFATVQYSEFITGFDGFVDGGEDCLFDAVNQAIRLQDNNGEASSTWQEESMDLSNCDALKVAFRYFTFGMEPGEDFFVELWDGTDWIPVLNLISGIDFRNEVKDYGFVRIGNDSINFSQNAVVRFRCDASSKLDAVYLLDVGIYKRSETYTGINPSSKNNPEISIFPNPARSLIMICLDYNIDGEYFLLDISGKTVLKGDFSSSEFSINLKTIQSGIYFLQLKISNGSNEVFKLVKK